MKDFFSKCDQIHSFLRIWSHLPKKPLMENIIFCARIMALEANNYCFMFYQDVCRRTNIKVRVTKAYHNFDNQCATFVAKRTTLLHEM